MGKLCRPPKLVANDKLGDLTKDELIAELLRVRGEVAYHEMQEMDNRCWLDDERLYQQVIPDYKPRLRKLPARAVFLECCGMFHDNRQTPFETIDGLYEHWEQDKPY